MGDVIYALSKSQTDQNNQVTCIIPKYDCLDKTQLKNLKKIAHFTLPFNGDEIEVTIHQAKLGKITLLLIEPLDPTKYFKRGALYGEKDDSHRVR